MYSKEQIRNTLCNLKKEGLISINNTSSYESIPCIRVKACLMIKALFNIYGKKLEKVLYEQLNIELKYIGSIIHNSFMYRSLLNLYTENHR